jgi:hypothetical protein
MPIIGAERVADSREARNGALSMVNRDTVAAIAVRNLMRLPWCDLRGFDATLEMEEFNFGTYYICKATKNISSPVSGGQI